MNIVEYVCLVGGLTILKNMKVNGKDYPIYLGKQKMYKKCLKPPTRYHSLILFASLLGDKAATASQIDL